MTTSTAILSQPAVDFDEFELDVRVLVTYDSASRGTCPTDDGCGNTNQGGSSTCGTVPDLVPRRCRPAARPRAPQADSQI